jgi:hypothetical protein
LSRKNPHRAKKTSPTLAVSKFTVAKVPWSAAAAATAFGLSGSGAVAVLTKQKAEIDIAQKAVAAATALQGAIRGWDLDEVGTCVAGSEVV